MCLWLGCTSLGLGLQFGHKSVSFALYKEIYFFFMKMSRISLGLSGRDLKDKDFLGKSDPYVVISRPNMGGGLEIILTSETKQVKWNCILIRSSILTNCSEHVRSRLG